MEEDDHDHGHDDHEDHGGNAFEITGLAMGLTSFSIAIMHDGHADYTSMQIPVTVSEEVHCEDFSTEADCEAADCEWHEDEMACEDEGDDHDHEHCEDISTEADCEEADHCEWHEHGDESECEDAGDGDCDVDAHADVDGLIIEHDGVEIYSQFQGLVEGSLELPVNSTKDFSIHFLDNNLSLIHI